MSEEHKGEHRSHSEHHSHEAHGHHQSHGEKVPRRLLIVGFFMLSVGLLIGFLMGSFVPQQKASVPIDFGQKPSGSVLSSQEVSEKVISFINKEFLSTQGSKVANPVVTEKAGMYLVSFDITQGGKVVQQKAEVYASKDGKNLFLGTVLDLTKSLKEQIPSPIPEEPLEEEAPKEVVKAEKASAEAFVVTHCPFGVQFEKALIPVYELLKEKADIKVRYMDAMHGDYEKIEAINQLCLREEQPEAFWTYLKCFVEFNNNSRCLASAKVDLSKYNACVNGSRGLEYYNKDVSYSNSKGVRGSPTFFLNGVQVSVNRAAEDIKAKICEGFKNPPSECSTTLNKEAASPGFGPYGSSAPGNTASCG